MRTRTQKEYLAGVASGKVHIDNDPHCKQNLNKINSAINDSTRTLIQAYWRGYKDGMENKTEYYWFYFGKK